ncbi:hypothetical protein GCM10017781_35440 [Deinococcus metalli]|uniref:Uncharacterized protein n=1 Tax=Deinococcus metalli TaxID=1141878 RepID=A0ABQ3JSE7_9DEIO|nr:hypothetical protein GCM10017781_35440 [Deinococcus metalli]
MAKKMQASRSAISGPRVLRLGIWKPLLAGGAVVGWVMVRSGSGEKKGSADTADSRTPGRACGRRGADSWCGYSMPLPAFRCGESYGPRLRAASP